MCIVNCKYIKCQINNLPVCMFCSDGIGRTGTFCTIMLYHERLLVEHMADVFHAIKTICTQGPGIVENSVSKVL